MFIAAAIAAAAVTEDKKTVLRAGLGQIPKTSRLYEAVSKVIDLWENGVNVNEFFADLHSRWNEYNPHDWCHTISNAEIVSACLLFCEGFDSSIGTAVEQGFDTDCNGATVGSICGMLRGSDAIDNRRRTYHSGGSCGTDVSTHGLIAKKSGTSYVPLFF